MKKIFSSLLLAAAAFTTVTAAESVPYSHSFEGEGCLDGYSLDHFPSEGAAFNFTTAKGAPTYSFRDNVYIRSNRRSLDAWLITPKFELEAGKTYTITFNCAVSNGERELVGMFAATSSDPIELKQHSILEKGEYDLENNGVVTRRLFGYGFATADATVPVTTRFTPDASGEYNIGLWVCSDDTEGLYFAVYDFSISTRATGAVPGDVTGLKAVPDNIGYLKAEVSCTTPVKNEDGSTSALTKLEFLRDGEVFATVDNPESGKEYKVTDTGMANGNHRYGAVCHNAAGRGNDVEIDAVYVGTYQPSAATNVEAHEVTPGQVKITWNAPTSTINNHVLNPDMLTYKVVAYDLDDKVTEEFGPFSTTEATVTVTPVTGSPQFLSFGVISITSFGEGDVAKTNPVVVGTPEETPYFESFAEAKASHVYMTESVRYHADWYIRSMTGQDKDGGLLRFETNAIGSEANFYTGRIALPADKPMVLSFYHSGFSNNNINLLTVQASFDGGEFIVLGEYEPSTADWQRVSIDLSEYAGKTMQLRLNGQGRQDFYIMVDNISITEGADHDLTISNFEFPTEIERCETVPVSFTVKNIGKQTAAEYKLNLYCRDEVIRTFNSSEALEPGQEYTFEFDLTAGIEDLAMQTYYAAVEYDADEVIDNNASGRIVVTITNPELKVPQNLKASVDMRNVTLTWDTPEGADFDTENPFHHLIGYTVFRDNGMVNWATTQENTFTDKDVAVGKHSYHVIAVYGRGNSLKSNVVDVEVTDGNGIDGIIADLDGAPASVYTVNGQLINRAATAAELRQLPAGVYIIGNRKVAVK